MGRSEKFPPLPPKDSSQAVVLRDMPPSLTPESLAERKRELALLSRARVDKHFDDVVDRIMQLPDMSTDAKGTTSYEPLKLKLDALKWLSERGYGKSPQVIKLGADEGSPQAMLEKIAQKRTQEYLDQQEAERIRREAITTTEVTKEPE